MAVLLLVLGNEVPPLPLGHSIWAGDLGIHALVVLDLGLDPGENKEKKETKRKMNRMGKREWMREKKEKEEKDGCGYQ